MLVAYGSSLGGFGWSPDAQLPLRGGLGGRLELLLQGHLKGYSFFPAAVVVVGGASHLRIDFVAQAQDSVHLYQIRYRRTHRKYCQARRRYHYYKVVGFGPHQANRAHGAAGRARHQKESDCTGCGNDDVGLEVEVEEEVDFQADKQICAVDVASRAMQDPIRDGVYSNDLRHDH
jgi:hypothetical protein